MSRGVVGLGLVVALGTLFAPCAVAPRPEASQAEKAGQLIKYVAEDGGLEARVSPELEQGHVVGRYRLLEHVRVLGTVKPQHSSMVGLYGPNGHLIDGTWSRNQYWTPALGHKRQTPTMGLLPGLKRENITAENSALVHEDQDSMRGRWRLRNRVNRGAHGEVWRASLTELYPDNHEAPTLIEDDDGCITAGAEEEQDHLHFGKPQPHPSSRRTQSPPIVFILKRMLVEKGPHVRRAALREVYFGTKLRGVPQVATFVESLEVDGELWLVFIDHGVSFHEWVYASQVLPTGLSVLTPSNSWHLLRTHEYGPHQLQEIIKQVLSAVANVHAHNVTHRDVKPSNLVWSLRPARDNRTGDVLHSLAVSVIDFSSAYSPEPTASHLYGSEGPTRDEETLTYSPPEVILARTPSSRSDPSSTNRSPRAGVRDHERGTHAADGSAHHKRRAGEQHDREESAEFSLSYHQGPTNIHTGSRDGDGSNDDTRTGHRNHGETSEDDGTSTYTPDWSYDSWSVGVMVLEILLASNQVFTVDQRTRATLEWHLRFESDETLQKALYLAALSDLCIFNPDKSEDMFAATFPDGLGGANALWAIPNKRATQLLVSPVKCGPDEFATALHRRDSLDLGFRSLLGPEGLDLLQGLLRFSPQDRLRPAEALNHPYFDLELSPSTPQGSAAGGSGGGSTTGNSAKDNSGAPPSSPWSSRRGKTPASHGDISLLMNPTKPYSALKTRHARPKHCASPVLGGVTTFGGDASAESGVSSSTSSSSSATAPAVGENSVIPAPLWPRGILGRLRELLAQGEPRTQGLGRESLATSSFQLVRRSEAHAELPIMAWFRKWLSWTRAAGDSSGATEGPTSSSSRWTFSFTTTPTSTPTPTPTPTPTLNQGDGGTGPQDGADGIVDVDADGNREQLGELSMDQQQSASQAATPNSSPSAATTTHARPPLDPASPIKAPYHEAPGRRSDLVPSDMVFTCPKCGREFGDWQSCQAHAVARRHSHFCNYNGSKLPKCLSAHPLVQADPISGWCDLQGRRPRIEDHFSLIWDDRYRFWGVFDGHLGASAAQFAAHHLPTAVLQTVDMVEPDPLQLERAFHLTDAAFDNATSYSSRDRHSGTTATVLLITRGGMLVVANVGDSKAILCCQSDGSALPLTQDHTASNTEEARRVMKSGANITADDNVPRVNGRVVVTRSIGNLSLKPHLISKPHTAIMDLLSPSTVSMATDEGEVVKTFDGVPRFVVIASDGLWDVMTEGEVVLFVEDHYAKLSSSSSSPVSPAAEVSISTYDERPQLSPEPRRSPQQGDGDGTIWQRIAMSLAHEALVRGSLDNIGVLMVDIQQNQRQLSPFRVGAGADDDDDGTNHAGARAHGN